MLFFNANFICYCFYPTRKREEPKKKERIQRQELPPPPPSKKDHISAVFFD